MAIKDNTNPAAPAAINKVPAKRRRCFMACSLVSRLFRRPPCPVQQSALPSLTALRGHAFILAEVDNGRWDMGLNAKGKVVGPIRGMAGGKTTALPNFGAWKGHVPAY